MYRELAFLLLFLSALSVCFLAHTAVAFLSALLIVKLGADALLVIGVSSEMPACLNRCSWVFLATVQVTIIRRQLIKALVP